MSLAFHGVLGKKTFIPRRHVLRRHVPRRHVLTRQSGMAMYGWCGQHMSMTMAGCGRKRKLVVWNSRLAAYEGDQGRAAANCHNMLQGLKYDQANIYTLLLLCF